MNKTEQRKLKNKLFALNQAYEILAKLEVSGQLLDILADEIEDATNELDSDSMKELLRHEIYTTY